MRFHIQEFVNHFSKWQWSPSRVLLKWIVRLLDQLQWVFPGCWGKVSLLLLLQFPTMYVAEQGFNQVLHTRNKYRNHLHMKTKGNAIRFKLTNLHPALKKLTSKKPGARFAVVGTNSFLKMNFCKCNFCAN